MSVTLVEDVLNLDDDHAAKFLIILQRALDNTSGSPGSPFNERSRQTAYRTIIRLSQRCQKLPPSLFIEGTSLTSGLIIGGGFADIYEGRYRGQTVAIKRMRMLHGGAAEIVRVRNVYTRRHPFPEIKTDPELIIKINNSSLRPTRPSVGECQGVEIADEWWALILSCLKEDSSERPHEIQLRGFFSTQKYKRRFSAVTSRGVLETDHSKDIQDPPLAHASSQEYHITPGEGLTLGDEWLNARRSESLSPSVYYSAIGSRAAEQEANILRLTEDSDTFSVPSPLSSCSDDSIHGSVHTLSYVRDQEPEYTVRANSGCFTCRIRRKKCDEQIDDQGCCGTCVRLRLQCLGFGAKLPDYLKDGKQVATYRDKIKTFLASNGMIRGHANSGSRVAEQEANILRLTEDSDTSSAPSPTPSLSSCSDDARHGSVHTLSHVRDQEPQYTLESVEDEPEYGYPGFKPHAQQLYKTPSQFHGILNDYPMSFPSSSLPLSPAAWPNPSTVPPSQPPTNASSFGSSYYISPNDVDDDAYNSVPNDEYIHIETVSWFPRVPAGDEYVVHYLNHLLPRQFLLADHGTIHYIMYDMLHRTPSARSAVILLAFLYQERLRDFKFNGHGGYPDDTEIFTSLVVNVQNALASSSQQRSEGDAMAGLIVVSCCLFTGGRGRWQEFLGVARQWVGNLLENSGHRIPRAVVADCTESTLFVVKTTLWFDVLASITELQPPALMNTFRDLFDPQGAYVEDPYPVFPGLSMLTPMGCENLVVLGLAETSNLAWWKENEINHRRLSMFELYDRAKDIELRYLGPPQPSPPSYGTPDEDLRHRVSDIFRASARVLLFSILHYDSPHSQEVKLAVEETVSCLKLVPHDEPKMINRALPCVAFSICVAGCLTDDPSHQRYFLDRLRGFKDSAIGNTRSVRDVLETVWKRRRESGERVAWREVMHEMGPEKLLLLV
ncbi:hypothetical protein JAAARDRAFT_47740 [Jaapia argillacea MUCL 33604]|uniref:Zn(2)-C6 fungal-type domain-containing protein n=1 Tax=Jaapia argillacea MUCL 33604 TaxID=933084 RepID=A0A067PQN6_9AGAM|nr:hypothetical protein JAAARDRAFT_47740 [Jaapia argillacea MUCL 33604]